MITCTILGVPYCIYSMIIKAPKFINQELDMMKYKILAKQAALPGATHPRPLDPKWSLYAKPSASMSEVLTVKSETRLPSNLEALVQIKSSQNHCVETRREPLKLKVQKSELLAGVPPCRYFAVIPES